MTLPYPRQARRQKAVAKPAAKSAAKPAAVAAAVAAAPVAPVAPVAETVVVAETVAVAAPAPAPAPAAPAVAAPAVVAEAAALPSLDQVGAQAQAAALKSYEEVSAVAKGALDAVVASSEALSQGLQGLGNTVLGLTQQSIDEGVAATRQILAAKTIRELVDLQAALAKSQFDRLLTEAPRLGEQSVKLVEDAVAPLSASVNAAVDKLVKAAA